MSVCVSKVYTRGVSNILLTFTHFILIMFNCKTNEMSSILSVASQSSTPLENQDRELWKAVCPSWDFTRSALTLEHHQEWSVTSSTLKERKEKGHSLLLDIIRILSTKEVASFRESTAWQAFTFLILPSRRCLESQLHPD